MRFSPRDLAVATSVAAGATQDVRELVNKTVQVWGTFTATVQVEGRAKTTATWLPIGAPLTAPGFVDVPQTLAEIRLNTTAFTSGVPLAALAAYDSRSE